MVDNYIQFSMWGMAITLISFWHDQWAQDRALNIMFPYLFHIFYEQKITVNQVLQARS